MSKPIWAVETDEIFNSYSDYLKGRWWQIRKVRFADKYKGICGFCGEEPPALHLHHLDYKNIGKERDKDLVYLCAGCHSTIHKCRKSEVEKIGLRRYPKKQTKNKKWHKPRKKKNRSRK